MTAIRAAAGHVDSLDSSGIRPFDIGKDLRPVAELIAESFASELDARGNAALREMRIMSHMSGILKVVNRTTGEFNDVFSGFVWVDDGRIVGNVTVQKADRQGSRWQIANVAVAPSHRGRGMARRLMHQALEHIEASGGRWAVLQVYARNDAARSLYDGLDFEYLSGKSDLILDQVPPLTDRTAEIQQIPNFFTFSASHWNELYELAKCQHQVQAQWWRPLQRHDYQINFEQQAGEWFSHVFGRSDVYRHCIQITRRFEAAIVLKAQRRSGQHKLQIWVRPDNYGLYEEAFMGWTMRMLAEYPRIPVTLELATSHTAAIEAAQANGFTIERTLLTMRKKMQDIR
jgi:ribosomal protein S18 acetylase RimI-like enzyme